ncbi:glycosyltransferase family 87 protein [Chitinophaga sp.]|uniref:glycosyltransferase family 87 protein n=1 Tax=Chitinophaga sp. TaxID=1869181 RepID=UPI0031DFA00D
MTLSAVPAAGTVCRSKTGGWLKHPAFIAAIYFVATIILYIQAISTGRYNNFIIFRSSFYHLIHGLPLYKIYPAEYFDYFLYHPSFPVLFAPFALLPKEVGLLGWMLASTAIFLYMIRQLPFADNIKYIIAWFLLIELSNAIQSEQTNPAMAALMVLTVVNLERQQSMRAALFTALCFFIKGYGAITGLAFLFFPRKGAFIGWGLVWFIAGSSLPLLFISPQLLWQHYADWFHLLTSSTIKEDGSLLGMLHGMLGLHTTTSELFDKIALLLAVAMLLHVLICGLVKRVRGFSWMLPAYLLIWIVVFNQSTESPTYIMAVTGVAIGCYAMPLSPTWRNGLLWFTLVVVSLSPTDLVPKFINQYAIAWHIKALPCTVVLLFLQACIGGWRNSSVTVYNK